MKSKISAILVAMIFTLSMVAVTMEAYGRGCGGGGGGGCGGGGTSTTPLSDYEKQALNIAIDEEYKAKAVYQKVIDTFGQISPFPWIKRDEQMHINWIANLLTKYGLPVPIDSWTGNVPLEFYSKQQACEIGAQAEFDNAAVYDQMIPQISHTDIISTFGKLRDVSRYKHLPTFQEWATIYAAGGQ